MHARYQARVATIFRFRGLVKKFVRNHNYLPHLLAHSYLIGEVRSFEFVLNRLILLIGKFASEA